MTVSPNERRLERIPSLMLQRLLRSAGRWCTRALIVETDVNVERILASSIRTAAFVTAFTLGSTSHSQIPRAKLLAPSTKPTPNAPVQPPSRTQSQPQLTAEDLGAFLDGFVPFELERENIAGAVVLVVKDGHILYQKGYGYADVNKQVPVSADQTLFRPGSISKLFTWTAVMQLVQAGKIDLHADINQYLDFRIPAVYPQPITMWNLMTHTPVSKRQ